MRSWRSQHTESIDGQVLLLALDAQNLRWERHLTELSKDEMENGIES